LIQDYSDLREKHHRLLKVCQDQEKALEEVGVRLRDTKLEADHFKWVLTALVNVWTKLMITFSIGKLQHLFGYAMLNGLPMIKYQAVDCATRSLTWPVAR